MPLHHLAWTTFQGIIQDTVETPYIPEPNTIIKESPAMPHEVMAIMARSCPGDCDLIITLDAAFLIGDSTWQELYDTLIASFVEYNNAILFEEAAKRN